MKTLTVLGSTGSIGTNTLDVVRRGALGPDHQYRVYALVAGHNVETLAAQIREFRPKVAVVATSADLDRLDRAGWNRPACRAANGRSWAGARKPAFRPPRPRRWIRSFPPSWG